MRRALITLALLGSLFSQPSLLDPLWSLLSSLWSEAGCGADPNGDCPLGPQPQTDEGCGSDPNGRPWCS